MRLKMASAVEGCLYRRLNVVPGRPSRYSKDRREDADMISIARLGLLFDISDVTCLSWLLYHNSTSTEKELGVAGMLESRKSGQDSCDRIMPPWTCLDLLRNCA